MRPANVYIKSRIDDRTISPNVDAPLFICGSRMLTKKLKTKIRSINSIASKVPHLTMKPNDESNIFCNSGHLLLELLCTAILYIKLILDEHMIYTVPTH